MSFFSDGRTHVQHGLEYHIVEKIVIAFRAFGSFI